MDPDPSVIGFQEMFERYRLSNPAWFLTESDSGPGPAADLGRSLRWAKESAQWMLGVRADDDETATTTITVTTISRVCLLVAAILAIAATSRAWAHGDPASHYLETDPLYPSFARQPSVETQLRLLGLLQAAERRGYPIKVALVAGAEDLVRAPAGAKL